MVIQMPLLITHTKEQFDKKLIYELGFAKDYLYQKTNIPTIEHIRRTKKAPTLLIHNEKIIIEAYLSLIFKESRIFKTPMTLSKLLDTPPIELNAELIELYKRHIDTLSQSDIEQIEKDIDLLKIDIGLIIQNDDSTVYPLSITDERLNSKEQRTTIEKKISDAMNHLNGAKGTLINHNKDTPDYFIVRIKDKRPNLLTPHFFQLNFGLRCNLIKLTFDPTIAPEISLNKHLIEQTQNVPAYVLHKYKIYYVHNESFQLHITPLRTNSAAPKGLHRLFPKNYNQAEIASTKSLKLIRLATLNGKFIDTSYPEKTHCTKIVVQFLELINLIKGSSLDIECGVSYPLLPGLTKTQQESNLFTIIPPKNTTLQAEPSALPAHLPHPAKSPITSEATQETPLPGQLAKLSIQSPCFFHQKPKPPHPVENTKITPNTHSRITTV